MTDIAFDRADGNGTFLTFVERSFQSLDFYWVPQGCPGSMGLDKANTFGFDSGCPLSGFNNLGLSLYAGGGISHFSIPIIVHGTS